MSDSAPNVPGASPCRPRRRRHLRAAPKPLQITARDAFVIHRVFLSRLCSSQATYVFARTADPEGGGDNWSRRLRVLYDGGFLTRLYLPQSRYLGGSQWPVYCVESGMAAAAAELRQPWRSIDRKTRQRLLARTAGTRERVLELLTTESHMPVEMIEAALRANTEFALRLYSGERCHVSHALLASTFAAILWFGFSRVGIAVEHMLPEGAVDLAKFGHGAPLLPDSFFVAGRTAVAVEAETGASSRRKILDKVRRYSVVGATSEFLSRIGVSFDRLLVVFHCATAAHVRLVSDVIAQEYPHGSDLFLVSHADAFHLEYSHLHFRRNLAVEDAAAVEIHLYDALASLVTRALFGQVEGLADGRAVIGYVPISGACDAPLGAHGEA
jgi:hypothetical protein